MSTQSKTTPETVSPHALPQGDSPETWTPEDPVFWAARGSRIAWRTLLLTTISLVLSFSTCFLLFCRIAPAIANAEIKGAAHLRKRQASTSVSRENAA